MLNKKRERPNDTEKKEIVEETAFFKDEIAKPNDNDDELDNDIPNKKTTEGKWKNKQRVLFVASRGISNQQRILMNNIISLVPHSKKECKIERKVAIEDLNEICYNHSCSNCLYFENKKREFVLWVFKSPEGPSLKFQINNIHTLDEPKMMGNCLKYSRPILSFDSSFNHDMPHLDLIKEIFTHVFNVPRYHPKSKPFHDHVVNFYSVQDNIYFRNYQILNELKETFKATDDTSKLQLVEIGPRFSLKLIKIFDGVLGGKCLYTNPSYVPPSLILKKNAMKFKERVLKQSKKNDEIKEKTSKPVDLSTRWISEI
jgi:ribosome biogenesis protein BRX1